jgi:hypothetical protein
VQQLLATVSRASTDEPKVPVASDQTEEFPPRSKYPTAPDDDSLVAQGDGQMKSEISNAKNR